MAGPKGAALVQLKQPSVQPGLFLRRHSERPPLVVAESCSRVMPRLLMGGAGVATRSLSMLTVCGDNNGIGVGGVGGVSCSAMFKPHVT